MATADSRSTDRSQIQPPECAAVAGTLEPPLHYGGRSVVLALEPGDGGTFHRLAIEIKKDHGYVVVLNGTDVDCYPRIDDAMSRARRIEMSMEPRLGHVVPSAASSTEAKRSNSDRNSGIRS